MASPVPTTVRVFQTDSGHSSQHEASEREAGPDLTASNSPSRDISDNQMLESQPLPKRRRVTRACDECRRKRIKCDGKHPCAHCTVYGYECTYNQPSNRRRNASPQSIKALETQLKRAKALMQVVLPTVDLSDPSIDAQLQSGLLLQLPMGRSQPKVMPAFQLEAMLPGLSQLDLNEEEIWNYHGSSLDRLPYLRHRSTSRAARPPSPIQSPAGWSTAPSPGIDLPSMEEARLICDHAILNVSIMLSAVHLPTFHKQLERIYTMSPEDYGSAENSFLPLLYAVLALGKAFAKRDDESDVASCDALVDEGFLYFNASRELLDITDCRDLTSLQAVIFMIQFLQLSAKLSTCYAYIGVALRSALCMGLHRSLDATFTMIEAETRKRAFWIIRRMDTHVGAMLGLPRFLEDQDIDQEWPSEVDDEYITQTEISLMPEGNVSVMAAFNAHTRLVQVLNKICRYVYPLKGTRSGGEYPKTHTVSHFKIQELEQELAQWLDELPMALKLGGEAPPNTIRVQQLLRMAFGHAQLLLYRPFLHYASQSYKHKTVDQTASACASACVGVSRNIIHIGTEMRWQGLLAESFWFSTYTIFFAAVSILYLVLQDPTSPTNFELLGDAMKGRKMLAFLAKRSAAADRCSNALKGMFEKLPKSARSDEETVESKKRRRGTSPLFLAVGPNLPKRDGFMGPHHVSTFSESVPCSKRTAHHRSLPIPQPRPVSPGWKPTYNFPWPMNRDFLSTMPGCSPTGTADQSPGEAWSDQQNYEAW